MKTIIATTERDKLAFEYLQKVYGEARINVAVAKLAGGRKPYISNIAKLMNVTIPDDLQPTEKSPVAKEHLAKIRAMLRKKG